MWREPGPRGLTPTCESQHDTDASGEALAPTDVPCSARQPLGQVGPTAREHTAPGAGGLPVLTAALSLRVMRPGLQPRPTGLLVSVHRGGDQCQSFAFQCLFIKVALPRATIPLDAHFNGVRDIFLAI